MNAGRSCGNGLLKEMSGTHHFLLDLQPLKLNVLRFARHELSKNEIRGADGTGRLFVSKVLAEAGGRIWTRGIAGTNFRAEGGDGSLGAPVVMEQGVENVERVLRCLTPCEGAKFQRQEWAGLADSQGCILWIVGKVLARDPHRAGSF